MLGPEGLESLEVQWTVNKAHPQVLQDLVVPEACVDSGRYTFKDISLLKQAFMAPGSAHDGISNRPLAWFGDATLSMLAMEGIAARVLKSAASSTFPAHVSFKTFWNRELIALKNCLSSRE